jgi:hypothetical protein
MKMNKKTGERFKKNTLIEASHTPILKTFYSVEW